MRMSLHSLRRNRSGFTLIEVTLAIAVALIGIVGVLAILPQGMQSARSAADNTITATVVENIFSQLRTGNFQQGGGTVICTDPTCSSYVQINLGKDSPVETFYFDQAGVITNASRVAWNTYYQMTLTYTNQAQQGLPLLSLVTATVVWPAQAQSPPNTNIFTTEIAQYDLP